MDEMTPGEMGRALARIERKLDMNVDDHEKRLRTLERHMWMHHAAYGAGGLGAGGLLVYVVQAVVGS